MVRNDVTRRSPLKTTPDLRGENVILPGPNTGRELLGGNVKQTVPTCDVDGIRLVNLASHHPESDLQLVILSTCHPVIVSTVSPLMIMTPCYPFCELVTLQTSIMLDC